jgi:hypothetical protein
MSGRSRRRQDSKEQRTTDDGDFTRPEEPTRRLWTPSIMKPIVITPRPSNKATESSNSTRRESSRTASSDNIAGVPKLLSRSNPGFLSQTLNKNPTGSVHRTQAPAEVKLQRPLIQDPLLIKQHLKADTQKQKHELFPDRPYTLPLQCKLVDEKLSFEVNNTSKMLIDSPTFVVGIIGRQGVGKTSIAHAIAGHSHESVVSRPRKHTKGIDMTITPVARTIILDSQPLMAFEKSKMPDYYRQRPHVWQELCSVKIIMFLLSACDVVVVKSVNLVRQSR